MKRAAAMLALLTMLLCGCAPAEAEVSFFAMDAVMALRAYGDAAPAALPAAEAEIERLDRLWSAASPDSELAAANAGGGAPVPVSPETAALLADSLALSRETGGALSLTLRPLLQAWGFAGGEYRVPSEAELAELLPLVRDDAVQADEAAGTVSVPAGTELDLGAVGKGRAADRAAALLREAGVFSALLNLGGSTIRVLGTKPDGSPWRVAVRDPLDGDAYAGVVEITDGAVSTSGGYERYFEADGEAYWHILDPKTGLPARSGLLSATVLSADAFTGDALSTALFVLGPEAAAACWRETGGFEYILLGEDGRIWLTEGAAAVFTPTGRYASAELVIVTR